MSSVMPHFKFRFADISGARVLCVESGGKIFCEVPRPSEFYHVFGYPADPAQQPGLLPDEFLWTEYVNNPKADFSSCMQIHIIEYLKKHSELFMTEFGEHCDKWIADHVTLREKKGISCIACRLNPERKI